MKILLLFILICSLTIACKKVCSEEEDCTSDELSWLPYRNGQILIFKNDSSEIDSFSVEINAYYLNVTNSNDECLRVQIVKESFQVMNDFLMLQIMHDVNIPKTRPEPNLQTRWTRNFIFDSPDTSQTVLDNISYSNLRLFLPSNNANGTSRIRNVYYSNIKGIVSFQSPDGKMWHLLN